MNLYIRYFNEEVLVSSIDEAIEFISIVIGIPVDEALVEDLDNFVKSPVCYPKRYKVRPRVYFIVIKTQANSLEEFKANKKDEAESQGCGECEVASSKKDYKSAMLSMEIEGWYEGTILFKRVVPIPGTGKFQYKDTRFVAQLKAKSGQHCYDRIVDHLKNRQDVDLRSQFPSAKGRNFSYVYLGEKRPEHKDC